MKLKSKLLIAFFILIFLAAVGFILAWVIIQHEEYGDKIKPGDKYRVGNKVYTLPRQPVKVDNKPFSYNQEIRILKENTLIKLRELLISVTKLMDDVQIPYFLSGGTLIGMTVFKTIMPWDDDLDIHCFWNDREFLWNNESFLKKCQEYNLEVIHLVGSSLSAATKEGAATRLRFIGTKYPVCDVFFEKGQDDEHLAKVDAWYKDKIVFSKKEIWNKQDVLPLKYEVIDDIKVSLPNNPEALLKAQYGDKVMERMVYRSIMLAHSFCFKFLDLFWYVEKPK
jgi:hypothetical protein